MGRLAGLVAGLMVMVTCVACSNTFSSPTPVPGTVRVSIGIYYSGGPFPGVWHSPVAGTLTLERDGELVTTRNMKEGQTMDLYVKPGNFLATAVSGDANCFAKAFTAVAGRPVSEKVTCSIR